jgi:uncharacterized protein (UPF0335 family)
MTEVKTRTRRKAASQPVDDDYTNEVAGAGHNNPPEDTEQEYVTTEAQTIAVEQLRGFIDKAQMLKKHQADLNDAKKELRAMVKGSGFDPKVFAYILKILDEDPDKRAERESMEQLYRDALEID